MTADYAELKKHRIREIREAQIHSSYVRSIERNARIKHHGDGIDSRILIVTTDRGAVGWGLNATRDEVPSDFEGVSVADIFDPRVGVTARAALSLDFALHDLAGTILNKPVSGMLGGRGESAVRCYDGAIYMDDLLPEEDPIGVKGILENCRRDHSLGYRDFKIKVGRGFQWMDREEGLERDIAVTRAVRERYPKSDLLVDANDGFTLEDAIRYMEAVADCNLYWFEEPFREEREPLRELKRFLSKSSPGTLVADGESKPEIDYLLELAGQGLVDVLLMDIRSYGLTSWRRIMPRIEQLGVKASPHAWGDPLKCVYAVQLAAGLGNVPTVEGVPSATEGDVLEEYRLEEGFLRRPEGTAGFAMRLSQDLL